MRLVEVYLPRRYYAEHLPKNLDRKIRGKYGVPVKNMPEDLYSFAGSRDTTPPDNWPECMAPTEWHDSGFFGQFGAAGALLSQQTSEGRRYLLAKRSVRSAHQPSLWGLPGGAIEPGETPLECATREVEEELGIPSLAGGNVLGQVLFEHPWGWSYTNFAVDLLRVPKCHPDGKEIAAADWFTEEDLLNLAQRGHVIPEPDARLPALLALFI